MAPPPAEIGSRGGGWAAATPSPPPPGELNLECEEFDGLAVANIYPSYDNDGHPPLSVMARPRVRGAAGACPRSRRTAAERMVLLVLEGLASLRGKIIQPAARVT